MLPVQHLSHSPESLWQKTGRGRNRALRWEGTAGPKGTQCQQPAPSSLGTAQGSAWQPWRAPLVFLCLVTWGCRVGWGQADGVGMNPAHDPPSGDPPADQVPPSCSRCWFPWNIPKGTTQIHVRLLWLRAPPKPHHPVATWSTLHHQSSSVTPFCPKLKDTCFEATSEV